jgi:hypothetical protein
MSAHALAARFVRREPGTGEGADLDAAPLPPHSIEAEQSVLGACLLDPAALDRVRGAIRAEDFYRADHRAIFAAIERVHHEDGTPDVLTVAEALRAGDELERCGGLAYLQGLASATPSAANVATYARIVAERARLRELAAAGEKLRLAAMMPGATVGEITAEGARVLSGLDATPALAPLDLAALSRLEPAPPHSLMPGLPAGYAMLLAGHGGAGKSQVALMLAACLASGRFFFGLEVARAAKVLFLSCEDRAAVIHWRLSRICRWLGIDLADLAGRLHVVDMVGRDAIMWRPDPRAGFVLTPAFHDVAALVRANGIEVLFVDGITDAFGGNENDKGQAKAFVNALLALVPADAGALVLIGHVPKSTAAGFSTEGYSGSAGWHNAVRARWYLYPETKPGEDGERAERTGAMVLELQKANHGGDGISVRLEWDEPAHLFTGQVVGGASRFDRAHQERTERAGILAAFKACAEASPPVHVPAAQSGNRTGFHVLSLRPEFPPALREGRAATRRFWRHVEALRQVHALAECSIRRTNRHLLACLEITAEGLRQCAE